MTVSHGVCFDFRNEDLAKLTAAFREAGKIAFAVCHGRAGLLEVKLSGGGDRRAGMLKTRASSAA
jgi:putative intracellular protease/amidase